MMEKSFKIKIITPRKVVEEEGITEMRVITDKGEITILPNHAEYLANIEISILKLFRNTETKSLAVGGGVIHFDESANTANLIISSVYSETDINVEKLKEQEAHYEEKLKGEAILNEHKLAERNLRQIINQLSLINKK